LSTQHPLPSQSAISLWINLSKSSLKNSSTHERHYNRSWNMKRLWLRKKRISSVGHELAHKQFGDLVTLKDWL
jgi:hypothetical protein